MSNKVKIEYRSMERILLDFFFLAIVGKYHYLLYFLALAIQPRMLVTFDESLRPLPVPVRVGQVNAPSFLERNLLKLIQSIDF